MPARPGRQRLLSGSLTFSGNTLTKNELFQFHLSFTSGTTVATVNKNFYISIDGSNWYLISSAKTTNLGNCNLISGNITISQIGSSGILTISSGSYYDTTNGWYVTTLTGDTTQNITFYFGVQEQAGSNVHFVQIEDFYIYSVGNGKDGTSGSSGTSGISSQSSSFNT